MQQLDEQDERDVPIVDQDAGVVIDEQDAEERVVLLILEDARQVGVDTVSYSVRILVAYKVMVAVNLERELALSTAVLLVGSDLFGRRTNWMRRTRGLARVWLGSKVRKRFSKR